MAQTVGDFLLTRLGEWGVTRLYGYPGDGINGILGALERAQDRIRFVQVRHEEMAAFMACAPRQVHRGGRCLPGDLGTWRDSPAQRPVRRPDGPPAGRGHRRAVRRARRWAATIQQEVVLAVAVQGCGGHEFVQTAMVPEQIRHLVDRAVRIARSQRTVTCIIIPNDLQELDAAVRRGRTPRCTPALGYCQPARHPHDADLRQCSRHPQRRKESRHAGGRRHTAGDG